MNVADLMGLFVGFFRASILGYGGGPSSIPLMEVEVVNQYGWLTQEEFANTLAIANSLPGPIATKIGGYVGYHVAGWLGATIAIIATVAPTALAMIGLYSVLKQFSGSPVLKGMIRGVQPVVWVLFLALAWEYLAFVRAPASIVLAALSLVGMYWLKLHPAVLVLFGLVAGAIWLRPQ